MTLRVTLIGDIFPGELSFTIDYGIRSQFEGHQGKPWVSRVKQILGDSDIVIGNLECPLVEKEKALKPTFYGNPDFAGFLKECGINVLNVANNHILEQGDQGFLKTIESLEGAGLGVVGNVVNLQSRILIKEVKGLRIAIAGFSNVDLHKIENNARFAVLSEDNVLSTLDLMKQQNADIKILCLHWGNEYVHIPSPVQKMMAYQFIDAGADIIAGHHPHVIQPYEKYKNGHVFYSLGNFMFDYLQSKKISIGLQAVIEVSKKKVNTIEFHGVDLSYKNLIKKANKNRFSSFFNQINKKYGELILMDDLEYGSFYRSTLKRNHLLERIHMKMSLVSEFYRIEMKAKRHLIRNIFSYYLKK